MHKDKESSTKAWKLLVDTQQSKITVLSPAAMDCNSFSARDGASGAPFYCMLKNLAWLILCKSHAGNYRFYYLICITTILCPEHSIPQHLMLFFILRFKVFHLNYEICGQSTCWESMRTWIWIPDPMQKCNFSALAMRWEVEAEAPKTRGSARLTSAAGNRRPCVKKGGRWEPMPEVVLLPSHRLWHVHVQIYIH